MIHQTGSRSLKLLQYIAESQIAMAVVGAVRESDPSTHSAPRRQQSDDSGESQVERHVFCDEFSSGAYNSAAPLCCDDVRPSLSVRSTRQQCPAAAAAAAAALDGDSIIITRCERTTLLAATAQRWTSLDPLCPCSFYRHCVSKRILTF